MGIKDDMPVLARHEGAWEGSYRHYDPEGRLLDAHSSLLICRFPEDAAFPYHQTNLYVWADGRREVRDFKASYADRRIWFDNDLIKGWAGELDFDTHHRTVVLHWERTGDPDLYLYEMIQLADDGQARCRTWHWIRGGRLVTRTAIEERLATRDWRTREAEVQGAPPS